MITKKKLEEQIKSLPDQFSIEELIEKLILIEKIENANEQSKNKEVITEKELNDEIEKWFK